MASSEAEQRALALVPKITGGISFVFSSIMAIHILRHPQKRRKFYHQLILGMSMSDMLSSISMGMSTWPIPSDSGVLWASGNNMGCTAQGFFLQVALVSVIYNVSLSFYYLLAIKHSWKDTRLFKWALVFHGIPLASGLGTAIAGVALNIFHSANLWCWIGTNPSAPSEDVNVYRMTFFYGPLWFSIIMVTINLILVFLYVRRITLKSQTYTTSWMTSSSPNNAAFDASGRSNGEELYLDQGFSKEFELPGKNKSNRNAEKNHAEDLRVQPTTRVSPEFSLADRKREVAMQSLRFVISFLITWLPISSVRIAQMLELEVPFGLLLFAAMMTPMQGLPNFFAYLFPLIRTKLTAMRVKRSLESQTERNSSESGAPAPSTAGGISQSIDMAGRVQTREV